jgi:hypothetical protein
VLLNFLLNHVCPNAPDGAGNVSRFGNPLGRTYAFPRRGIAICGSEMISRTLAQMKFARPLRRGSLIDLAQENMQ